MVRRVEYNGRVHEFPDDVTEAEIRSALEQSERDTPQQRRNRPRSNNPGGSRPGANGLSAPNRQWLDARARRAQQRAPQGAPGTPLRMLEDFNRNGPAAVMNQMWRNLGVGDELAGFSAQLQAGGIPGTARGRAQYDAARSYERDEQRRVAREQPGVNVGSYVASVPAMGGTPLMNIPRVGMLEAGAGAAGINAPFALGRQEGSFMERVPGALRETAVVAPLSAGFQGLANRFLATPATNSASQRAATFDRAGVRPTMAAVSAPEPPANVPVTADPGRTAVVTRAISENPVVGAIPMRHMRRSLGDTAARAEQLARSYGQRMGPEATGEQVQAGLRRFAFGEGAGNARPTDAIRNWSFDQRVTQLYEQWWGKFRQAEQAWRSRGQAPPQAVADQTRIVLDDIFGRNTPEVASELNDQVLTRLRNLVGQRGPGGNAGAGRTFQDLRDIRTYVRQLQKSDPSLRPTLSNANLQRIEEALTTDMYATAIFTGGPRLARELRQIDRYYRVGNERISSSLRTFLRENETPAQAYARIIAAASEGGRQNTRLLLAARRSLQPHEWRQVAATAIDEMGRAPKGHPYAAEGAFSVEQFSTRWNAMSADGRRALFGNLGSPEGAPQGGAFIDLESALNDLARVAGMQKAVERAANHSNTAVVGQAVGTVGGLVISPQTMIPLLVSMGILGEALTNPAFVRWMVSAARAGGGAGGMRRQLGQLATIAARDPALVPLYNDLTRRAGENFPAQEAQQPQYTEQYQ